MNTRKPTTSFFTDPLFIGFESVLDKLDKATGSNVSYPPYNIVKIGENEFLIELAVAGFSEDDLNVELHDGSLTVSACIGDADNDKTEYLYKGIATRNFTRKFVVSDTVQVEGADLKNGMLIIKLVNAIPEERQPKKIPVNVVEKQLLTE